MPLAAALVRRGGDLTLRDRHGRSPLELVKREQDVEDIAVGHFKAAERSPLLVREGWPGIPRVVAVLAAAAAAAAAVLVLVLVVLLPSFPFPELLAVQL